MSQNFQKKNQPTKKCPKSSESLGGGVKPFWKKSTFNLHFFFEKLPKGGSCNSCRRAIVKCNMCGENGGEGGGDFCGGRDGGFGSGRGSCNDDGVEQEKNQHKHY